MATPEPKELAIFPGVDHFWVGSESAMADRVAQFFVKFLNAPTVARTRVSA
ncbi:MAG: hypothetical protein HY900_24655 [Deltaproteobacteria bacterium]|nr:hypothetical protein [Deltaproteobacteria bacterium]